MNISPTEGPIAANTRRSIDDAMQEARRLVEIGVTVKRACETAGLKRITYYKRLNREQKMGAESSHSNALIDNPETPGSDPIKDTYVSLDRNEGDK